MFALILGEKGNRSLVQQDMWYLWGGKKHLIVASAHELLVIQFEEASRQQSGFRGVAVKLKFNNCCKCSEPAVMIVCLANSKTL